MLRITPEHFKPLCHLSRHLHNHFSRCLTYHPSKGGSILWYSISVLVCSALQSGDVNARDVARGLQKILSSGFQPSDLQEYAQLALHSPEPALRELALQQIGRFLQERLKHEESSSSANEQAAQLLNALRDPDPGVATATESILEQLAVQPEGLRVVLGPKNGTLVKELTQCQDPVHRMRALSLVTTLASATPEAAALIRSEGMLEALTDELSHPEDTLGCAAALRLVTQLAEKAGPAALGLLGKNLLSNLQRLFERGDDLLESSALTASGALLAAACAAGIDKTSLETGVYAFAVESLDNAFQSESSGKAEVIDAALGVAREVAHSQTGRELLAGSTGIPLAVAERALGLAGTSAGRIPALNCLSYLVAITSPELESQNARGPFDQIWEAKMQEILFKAAGSASLAGTLFARLRHPFEDSRVAVLGVIHSVCRHDWGAREVCSHRELMQNLYSPGNDLSRRTLLSQQACLKALLTTANRARGMNSDDLLSSYVEVLEQALQRIRVHRQTTAAPQIDVGRR